VTAIEGHFDCGNQATPRDLASALVGAGIFGCIMSSLNHIPKVTHTLPLLFPHGLAACSQELPGSNLQGEAMVDAGIASIRKATLANHLYHYWLMKTLCALCHVDAPSTIGASWKDRKVCLLR